MFYRKIFSEEFGEEGKGIFKSQKFRGDKWCLMSI